MHHAHTLDLQIVLHVKQMLEATAAPLTANTR